MDVADLNDVRIFVVVGQEGTLTSAAKKLRLPPSTVSRAITRLEKSLNVLLVRRSPRGFTLTDLGQDYLLSCRRALRTLEMGRENLAQRRDQPSGRIRIACPITMLYTIFGALLPTFLDRYPGIQVELDPYCSAWAQEPRDDVDVFFKVRSPKDSLRRVRLYPGVARGLFASAEYLARHKAPESPNDLESHQCIGSGSWELTRGVEMVSPQLSFLVTASDPSLHLDLVLRGLGIVELPLYMARWPENRNRLVRLLQEWHSKPIVLCALFYGPSKLTPKIQALLDFLGEYIGTERDPRVRGIPFEGLFTPPAASGKTGS